MKIGAMLGDITTSLFKKPVTERYPFERNLDPERLRGKLKYDATKCTGCGLCMKDCPSDAIEVITIDKANKRFIMKYDMGKCTFCNQCVFNCRAKSINLSNEEWELATLSEEPLTVYYGRKEDIQLFMERAAQPVPESETPI